MGYYWDDFLVHSDSKSHKYVQKISLGGNKYRYFYSESSYAAYLEEKYGSSSSTNPYEVGTKKWYNQTRKDNRHELKSAVKALKSEQKYEDKQEVKALRKENRQELKDNYKGDYSEARTTKIAENHKEVRDLKKSQRKDNRQEIKTVKKQIKKDQMYEIQQQIAQSIKEKRK